jgi:hypothetical protein
MGWLAKAWEKLTRDKIERVEDEILGPLVLEESSWQATVEVNGRTLQFSIGGGFEPDAVLIARAQEICRTFDQFARDVASFLAAEAEKPEGKMFADQIRSLVLKDICLFWPDRPEDGMLFFDGPDKSLVWRCDLKGKTPVGLGYDS